MKKLLSVILGLIFIAGCSAEVGSKEWCAEMKEKPKKEWTAEEAGNYGKHCLF